MTIVEKLLKIDKNQLKMPTGEVKIKLKKVGEVFTFPIVGIHPDILTDIKEEGLKIISGKKNKMEANIARYQGMLRTIIEGCPTVFKNGELQKNFGANSPMELVEILLLDGEMEKLSDAITDLTDLDEDEDINEVKN